MYNLNVNVNPNPGMAAGLLSVAAAELTPRTPEILNTVINMTNPFEGFPQQPSEQCSRDRRDSSSSGEPSPPSLQFTRSQLIKEGLKLTLQTKRQANGSGDDGKKKTRKEDGSADDEEDDESSNSKSNGGLTPEDEERRRRRRERNKIAATKCRLKKREKTVILVQESETLETQNHELKTQIQELELQRRKLVDMLNLHGPNCIKQPPCIDTSYEVESYGEPMQPLPSYQENFVPSMNPMGHHHQPGQTDSCAAISDYGPVKLEGYDAVAPDFYRQGSPYATTTTTNSDASCTV